VSVSLQLEVFCKDSLDISGGQSWSFHEGSVIPWMDTRQDLVRLVNYLFKYLFIYLLIYLHGGPVIPLVNVISYKRAIYLSLGH
jgi:hypothetical protein